MKAKHDQTFEMEEVRTCRSALIEVRKEYLGTFPKITFWFIILFKGFRRSACLGKLPNLSVLTISICGPSHPKILFENTLAVYVEFRIGHLKSPLASKFIVLGGSVMVTLPMVSSALFPEKEKLS